MTSTSDTAAIRRFIIQNVADHPGDIAGLAAEKFGVTRHAVNHHLRKLVSERVIGQTGNTRARRYSLTAETVEFSFPLADTLEEDVIWRDSVGPCLQEGLPQNVYGICQHGFTEMVNNAIDHSGGDTLHVAVVRSATTIELRVADDGVGIFQKIQQAIGLRSEADAVLELVKGKFTTDPQRHMGEGIFFTSRMFDQFLILSGGVFFCHTPDDRDWVVERVSQHGGTLVTMTIDASTERTATEVFDRFAGPEEYNFSVTHVPVALAKRGQENLVSRSQAKRLVRGFERFEEVILDFTDVESIGQAFSDEVFRVFQLDHPDVRLRFIHANSAVQRMILRAVHALNESSSQP